jgi:hypothetical protein
MPNSKKLLQAAAGAAGGAGLDIPEVFSTYVYDGTGSAQTITNGIDLSGEGGLVWTKKRSGSSATSHVLHDSARGVTKGLITDTTGAEIDYTVSGVTSFNSSGYVLGTGNAWNNSDSTYVSWTWRKAPKFFDVQTWTGNGTSGRTISHNLGSVPGCIIVKRTDTTDNWFVYHRGLNVDSDNAPETDVIMLNSSNAAFDNPLWNDYAPTSSDFQISNNAGVNASGGTYVAYIFAHNNSDGDFGPNGDQDIIKCGSYTGNGSSTGPEIDLGFEPQWIMIKDVTANNWVIQDVMRGIATGGNDPYLHPNSSSAETGNFDSIDVTATGFKIKTSSGTFNDNGDTHIYMAIRRGPLAEPTSATDVFAVDNGNSSDSDPTFISNFPVDMAIRKLTTGSSGFISSRLTWQLLNTDNTNAEGTGSTLAFDNMDGYEDFAAVTRGTEQQVIL